MGTKLISVVVILLGLTFNSFSQDVDSSVFKTLPIDLDRIEWIDSYEQDVDSTFKSIKFIEDKFNIGGINSAIINVEYNGVTYVLKYEYDRTVATIYTVYPPPPPHYGAKVYVYNGKEYIYVGEGIYSDGGCCTDPLSHIKKALNNK